MQMHNIKRNTKRKLSRQRGRGGKRGKTSGRGTKGMLARAGYKRRPEMRDIIKRLPKLRGYNFNSIETKPVTIDIVVIDKAFSAGDTVSPKILIEKGLIKTVSGKVPAVKILGKGKVSKKLIYSGCLISASVKEQIEKNGGSVSA